MSSHRLLFLCPDEPKPTGGIRKIYEFVTQLRAAGQDAWVVHQGTRFRPTWFETELPVLSARQTSARHGDLVVVPEIWADRIAELPGVPKVVLNQGHFYAQDRHFGDPTVVSIVVVSQHAEEFCRLAYPGAHVERVHVGVAPPKSRVPKEKRIVYMPRRGGERAGRLLAALERNGALVGWHLEAIEGRTAEEVAATLDRSAIFLSFSRSEGFGLPPVEAMSAGCLVIGYHGQGGREYFDRSWSLPVEDDDIATYLAVVLDVLENYDVRRDDYLAMGHRAAAMVRERYTPERQASDVVRAFASAQRTAERFPPFQPVRLPRISSNQDRLRRLRDRLLRDR